MLTTPTHHNRRLRAGAVLAAFGLGLPVGIAPALAETLTARAQVEVEASGITDADTAGSDEEAGLAGAAHLAADLSVHGYLNGLLDGSGDGPDWSGIADDSILSDVAASAAATGALALDIAGGGSGGGGGDLIPAVPGLFLDGELPLVGGAGSGDGESGELPSDVLGLLLSGAAFDLPGVGLPNLGVPGLGLPGGVPGLGVPGLGLPGPGVPGAGLPGLGIPGPGLPSRPDRLPSLVLPSVINPDPSDQDEDPAVAGAGHVGPVGGLVNGTEGNAGGVPGPGSGALTDLEPNSGPTQSGEEALGSLPRTGANLRLRALAAFGLLGLAGLGGRRRRSA